MRKINVEKPLLTIKGEPMEAEIPARGIRDAIIGQIKNYKITSSDELVKKFTEWQTVSRKTEVKPLKIRDSLLTMLGSRFPMIERKEAIWANRIAGLLADEKNKEIELSEDKFQFLKRIIEGNKIKEDQRTPMGTQEVERDLFYPYELGQLLEIFGEEEETKPKK